MFNLLDNVKQYRICQVEPQLSRRYCARLIIASGGMYVVYGGCQTVIYLFFH